MAQAFHSEREEALSRDQALYDHWVYLKDPVKERWDRLTDMRLEDIDGHRDRLVDQVQVVYGIHREQAETEVDEFMNDYHEYFRMISNRAPSTPLAPRAGQ